MKKSLVLIAGLVVSTSAVAGAQQNGGNQLPEAQCAPQAPTSPTQGVVQDACQQAYDLFQFMAPQLGLAVAGGNHTLGQNSTVGGLGHFSIGVHGTGFSGNLPKVGEYTQRTTGAAPARQLGTKSQFMGLPGADAAIGIFGGLPLALTNVGGLDLLLSASYVPTINSGALSIKPDQNLQIGFGARLGLLSESLIVPGVSLTYLKRDLPKTTITGSSSYVTTAGQTTASFTMSDVKVNTSGWRLVASKSLVFFGLAAGVGQDKYDQQANVTANVSTTLGGNATAAVFNSQSLTRTNYFVDGTMNLLVAKLTAEVGQVSGGTVNTYNTFEAGRPDRSQTYFSLGIRFGL